MRPHQLTTRYRTKKKKMFTSKVFYIVAFILVIQTNLISADCVHGDLYPHSSDCRLFYQCSHNHLFELRCPPGLYFNPVVSVCDFPENVDCETKTTRPTTTTTRRTTTTTERPTRTTTPPRPTTTTTERPTRTTTTSRPTTTTTRRTTTTTERPTRTTTPPRPTTTTTERPTRTTTTSMPTTTTTRRTTTTTERPTRTTTLPPTPAPQICQWELGQEIEMGNRCDVPQGFFVFQFDGNAVIYDSNYVPLWNSQTAGIGHIFVFQTDGNLVMYSSDGTAVWNSGTHNQGGSLLVFQQDRNLVIYNSATVALWNTQTHVA